MSEKKPKQNGEIDAFVKALLNKKTEMALNKDSQPEREDVSPAMTPVERQSAEKTMSSALDLLRKERGQLTIEEEEEKYRREQKEDGTHIEEVEDFTTDSIHQGARVDEQMIQSIYSSIELDDPKKAEKEAPKRKPLKKVRSARPKKKKETPEAVKKEKAETAKDKTKDETEKKAKAKKSEKPEKPETGEPSFFRKNLKWFLAGIAVFALLLGAYTYKVVVYDPANITTEAQEQTYQKLVEYADEWDMLSDAEKMELIDYEPAYNELLEKQKTRLNTYFEEQTGDSFVKQLEALKALKATQEDETKPEYQQLVAFVSNWSTKPDEEKAQIVHYKDAFNGLSAALQQKIDQICMEQAGKNFNTLAAEEQAKLDQASQAAQEAQAAANEQRARIQSQIDELHAQLNDAMTYKADLEAQQAAGEDVGAMIATNDQTIAYLNEQIAALQATLP